MEAAAEAAGVFAFAEATGMINYYVSPRKSESMPDLHAKVGATKESGEEESGYPVD